LNRPRSFTTVKNVAKVLVSVILLSLVLRGVVWEDIRRALGGVRLPCLAVAAALSVLSVVIRAVRWKLLTDSLGIGASLRSLVKLYFVGTFFSNLLPTGVGGDAVRAYELSRQTKSPASGVGSVVIERALGLLVQLTIGSVALVFASGLIGSSLELVIVLLGAAGWAGCVLLVYCDWSRLAALLRMPVLHKLQSAADVVRSCGWSPIWRAGLVSLVLSAVLIGTNYMVALALGVAINPWYFVLFVPIISSLLLLPVSVSGWGVREWAYVHLFSSAGVIPAQALTLSVLVQTMAMGNGLIGALCNAAGGIAALAKRDAGKRPG